MVTLSRRTALIILTATLPVVGGLFVVLKYLSFSYGALDLAIFSQVLSNTAHGHVLAFTIHPHPYFGDHIDLSLFFLAPLYALFHHPLTLLVIQIAALTIALWPLILLVQRHAARSWFPVALSAVYVGNLWVHNALAFEFHTLVFAVPLLLWMILAYEEERWRRFCLWTVLALFIREDMGLMVAGFGLLALVERRSRRWSVLPLCVGVAWFFAGVIGTGLINHEHYKFFAYYQWLGATPHEALHNALTQPWRILLTVLRPQTWVFLTASLLLFAGLPLLFLKKLLPGLLFFLAIALTGAGADEIVFRAHYTVAFLPFFLWATLLACERIARRPPRWMHRYLPSPLSVVMLLLGTVTVYSLVTWSPLGYAGWRTALGRLADPATRSARALSQQVNKSARIATSYSLLPSFTNHADLYSLHYAFLGHRQLSATPYILPPVDTMLYDSADFLLYTAQYSTQDSSVFLSGDNRLRHILTERRFSLINWVDSYFLFQQSIAPAQDIVRIGERAPYATHNATQNGPYIVATDLPTTTLTTSPLHIGSSTITIVPIALTWETQQHLDETYHMTLQYVDAHGRVRYAKRYALGYGLYPTTEWAPNVPVSLQYRFAVPSLPYGTYTLRIQLGVLQGYVSLDPTLTTTVVTTAPEQRGDPITLGTITL